MRIVVRTLAVLSVLSWIVVAGLFAGVQSGSVPAPTPAVSSGAPSLLAPDWTDRLLRDADDVFPGSPKQAAASELPIVRRQAARFGVDPLTVLAVIQVESQFDPKAVSAAGAKGLMQLEADTAAGLAADLGLEWTGEDLLFDPEMNVTLGTYYLRQLLDRFGDPDAALAAYCSGPSFVETRRDVAASIPMGYSDRVWDVLSALKAKTSS